jgi:hypothetical protein
MTIELFAYRNFDGDSFEIQLFEGKSLLALYLNSNNTENKYSRDNQLLVILEQ